MSTPGRGRSDRSKKYQAIEETRPTGEDRPEEASSSSATTAEASTPVRARGGFKQVALRTRPEDVLDKRANTDKLELVDVVANYVPIEPMKSQNVQMYRVDFEPTVESGSLMRFLFKNAAKTLFRLTPIYDGVHECRSGQKLAEDVTSFEVVDSKTQQSYTVKFTNTGTCSYGPEMSRIYNMQIKQFLREDLGFYSPQTGLYVHPGQSQLIRDRDIMLLRGYRTSANMHEGNKILMNLEAAHKLVQRFNVQELMEKKLRDNPGSDIKEMWRVALIGKIVVTSYNKCCYRVEDIDFDVKPTSVFDLKGTPTSFVDFYRARHDTEITNLSQPMLRVVPNSQRRREEEKGESKVILLVPELCNIAGLTEEQKRDSGLKFQLIKDTQIEPKDRVKHLREFLESFHENRNVKIKLADWGYSYGKEPIAFKAHVLPMTQYAVGSRNGEPVYSDPKSDSADFNVNQLAVVPEIQKMAIIVPRSQFNLKNQVMPRLRAGFERVGLNPKDRYEIDMRGDSANDFTKAITNITPDTTLALVLMQRQNKECYDAIKKAASCLKGLITQVVTTNLMMNEKRQQSAALKIAIQIAAKVGGEPWWVKIPLGDTMICGYDTYHDTLKRGRSYGAFVASLNDRYSKWWSKADAHERLEEVSSQMSVNLREALKIYMKFNGKYPSKIIIYRDGVGDGQLEHVFKIELSKVQEELEKMPSKIALTMIIVNKRIGARFYMKANNRFLNPTPGTVVDHTVTREERYDFYLISQFTRQGTVTPTYYNIIHDESGLPARVHQMLAYKLCLLYYNWSGTVRVPAPCQYAHKLALLCGEHLHGQPNARLDDKLHFL